MRPKRAWIVVGVCAYELVALGTGYVPTLTHISHTIRRHPLGAAVVAASVGVLAHHLLIEQATTSPDREACTCVHR